MRGKISRDSWRVGDCYHVRPTCLRVAYSCTLRLQSMHWRSSHSMRGKISRGSWRVGDCNHVRTTGLRVACNCTLHLQSMHRLSNHSMRGKISRCSKQKRNCRTGWSTETVVTCKCTLGLQSIQWRFRHSMKRGVCKGGCQAVVEIMRRTNWSTHWYRTGWREIKVQIDKDPPPVTWCDSESYWFYTSLKPSS